ncbi:PaaX family transcriptional regulator C-terminal domain-containing protein [Streptomyces sp. A475]|uniref:PaaX family transcriptional regulator C-terminal domain-containing protein n=1 Tax=Streptomyces sp. A475 TaxID=3131976 RepID=UPI0030C8E16D
MDSPVAPAWGCGSRPAPRTSPRRWRHSTSETPSPCCSRSRWDRRTPPTSSAAPSNIDAVAARYQAFLEQWDGGWPQAAGADNLARQILLHTDWLQVIRRDPHLPAEHLPEEWPAIRAEQVFRLLDRKVAPGAARLAADLLDEIEL